MKSFSTQDGSSMAMQRAPQRHDAKEQIAPGAQESDAFSQSPIAMLEDVPEGTAVGDDPIEGAR